MKVSRDILIEELIEKYPESVKFLSEKGIRCIICGEPIWGTLEEACVEKKFDDKKIDSIILELNELIK